MGNHLTEAIITRRRRVPLPEAQPGDGAAVARQLDAALMSAGFKLSRDLLTDLSARSAGQVADLGVMMLRAAREMAGDHVEHNPYFRDFPSGVPATLEFWAELAERAPAAGIAPGGAMVDIGGGELVGAGSLLSLPGYGTVQHTYEDMLAAHEALVVSAGDRITILHKGGTLREEAERLYLELAGSAVPLFPGRSGRAWTAWETRPGLDPAVRDAVLGMLDQAITERLPETGRLVVDPAVMGMALPLTGKPAAPGIGVLPRGSVSPVVPQDQDILTFFTYWRQTARRTDYDLSALMVTRDFNRSDTVSWRGYHSADEHGRPDPTGARLLG